MVASEHSRIVAVDGGDVTGWRWWVDAQVAFHKGDYVTVSMYACMWV
jgi:hypothetical protein